MRPASARPPGLRTLPSWWLIPDLAPGRPPSAGTQQAILALQRMAGNRAVTALLESSRTEGQGPVLQRCGCAKGSGGCAACARKDDEAVPVQRNEEKEGAAAPVAAACEPSKALTWDDYPGKKKGQLSAFTKPLIRPKKPKAGDTLKAVFSNGESWVKPVYKNPADRKLNGGGAKVTACEKAFAKGSPFYEVAGLDTSKCPAAIVFPGAHVTSKDECESVIGAGIDQATQEESVRLLQHEQVHFDMACVLVKKGNEAIAAGADPKTVRARVVAEFNKQAKAYDKDSKHGCIPGQQSAWEAEVAAGLPAVKIP
jgi:hypothetical protein